MRFRPRRGERWSDRRNGPRVAEADRPGPEPTVSSDAGGEGRPAPLRRHLRMSPMPERIFGSGRDRRWSSDSRWKGSPNGVGAVFGSQRRWTGRLEPLLLRYSVVRDGEHAASGAVFGPRRERRGEPSRWGLRVSEERNARLVRAELRLRWRWAAASGFPAGLRPRRGASGIARFGRSLRVSDSRANGPVEGDLRIRGERAHVRATRIFGCARGGQHVSSDGASAPEDRAGVRLEPAEVLRDRGQASSDGRFAQRGFGSGRRRGRKTQTEPSGSRRAGAARREGASGSHEGASASPRALWHRRVGRPFGSKRPRSRRVEPRFGSKGASALRGSGDRSARRDLGSGGSGSSGFDRRGFGFDGRTAAIRARGGFGLRGCERERDVEMVTSGDQHHEGIGVGDGVRPRGGSKALKGATP
jgi:hypothetical protein